MGVAVSGWRLAKAVASLGQLGVVSGTLLPIVLARRLQQGDPQGDLRRALAAFPYPAMAARILEKYFRPSGISENASYATVPLPSAESSKPLAELTVVANFVEVFLAKEGHCGRVGLNLLHKVQVATLPSLFGAMLAGVDYVLMGAGIPRDIPGAIDRFAAGETAEVSLEVVGATSGTAEAGSAPATRLQFSPRAFLDEEPPKLHRPYFLPIVSSAVLATTLARKSTGSVDGFIIEGDLAGGHNAPPRGPLQLSPAGEPIYGPRDVPELEKFRALGLPFWLAGSSATREKFEEALAAGAVGVQVGTAFAFCDESGIEPALKRQTLALIREGKASVFTDPLASPTGFPFKILGLEGSLSQPEIFEKRQRVCDLGYLRKAFTKEDGSLGYRCASEPIEAFVRKGGEESETTGRMCLCNGLLATVGLGQRHAEGDELPLLTAGNDVSNLARYLPEGRDSYTAADVINALLTPVADETAV